MKSFQFDTESMRANLWTLAHPNEPPAKTETRRLLNPQPTLAAGRNVWLVAFGKGDCLIAGDDLRIAPWAVYRRLYRPGDVCWVQEPHYRQWRCPRPCGMHSDGKAGVGVDYWFFDETRPPTSHLYPARFMRREWSRMNIRIESVRAEPVQEIQPADMILEGGGMALGQERMVSSADGFPDADALWTWWRDRWNGLHGKDAPWKSNPWVVVYRYLFY